LLLSFLTTLQDGQTYFVLGSTLYGIDISVDLFLQFDMRLKWQLIGI